MPLKGREYEERIQSMGFEKATAWATRELIERHNSLEKTLSECGEQLLEMIQVLDKVTDGTAMIRRKVEELSRRDKVDENHPNPSDGFDA